MNCHRLLVRKKHANGLDVEMVPATERLPEEATRGTTPAPAVVSGRGLKAVRCRFTDGCRSVGLGDQVKNKPSQKARKLASEADYLILALYPRVIIGAGEIRFSEEQHTLIQELCNIGKPVIVVSFGSPYVLNDIPHCDAFLACYGNADAVQQAAAEILFGTAHPSGRLPVTLNDSYMYYYGMSYHDS